MLPQDKTDELQNKFYQQAAAQQGTPVIVDQQGTPIVVDQQGTPVVIDQTAPIVTDSIPVTDKAATEVINQKPVSLPTEKPILSEKRAQNAVDARGFNSATATD